MSVVVQLEKYVHHKSRGTVVAVHGHWMPEYRREALCFIFHSIFLLIIFLTGMDLPPLPMCYWVELEHSWAFLICYWTQISIALRFRRCRTALWTQRTNTDGFPPACDGLGSGPTMVGFVSLQEGISRVAANNLLGTIVAPYLVHIDTHLSYFTISFHWFEFLFIYIYVYNYIYICMYIYICICIYI